MIIDKELEAFINNIIDSYGITENRQELFSICYYAGLEAKINPQVNEYWAYVRTIVTNTLRPIVKEALGIKAGE